MKITCTGRKVNLKDAFMQRVETKLAKLDKFVFRQRGGERYRDRGKGLADGGGDR